MRMLNKGLVLGTIAMLGTAAPALADEHVTVERDNTPHSTIGIVAKDGIYGGLAGAAVGGGIMLIQNNGFNGRTLAISSGVGLLAGVGLGLLDAASQHPSVASVAPETDRVARPEGHAAKTNETDTGLPPPAFSLQKSGSF